MSLHTDILTNEIEKLAENKSMNDILKDSENLLQSLKELYTLIENDEEYNLKDLEIKVDYYQNQTLRNEKSINKSIKNYNSKLEKCFTFNFDNVYRFQKIGVEGDQEKEIQLINRSIIMDLLQQGSFDTIDSLVKSNTKRDKNLETLVGIFKQLKFIVDNVKADNFQPAIDWSCEHSKELSNVSPKLEFELHRLRYIQIFDGDEKNKIEAYKYAKENFNKFQIDIDKIAGLLLNTLTQFNKHNQIQEINEFDELKKWCCIEIMKRFSKCCNEIKGIGSESKLSNCLLAGFISIDNFNKYNGIFRRKSMNWSSEEEMPFEVDLPRWLEYHCIFICPVNKEETTVDNPAMVLPCKHLISDKSLRKLSKDHMAKFKCPYCPVTCEWRSTKKVRFVAV